MTGIHMTRIVITFLLLAFSVSGQAALKLLLDGQEIIVETSVLDTSNGLLTVGSGSGLTCSGFATVDPALVPMAIQIDANQSAEIDNVTPGAFTIERVGPDTVITVTTVGGSMSCNVGPPLPEVFFVDDFESPLGQ
jgi:hypothetical protein